MEANEMEKGRNERKNYENYDFIFPQNMRFHNNNNENDGYDLISPFSYRLPYSFYVT